MISTRNATTNPREPTEAEYASAVRAAEACTTGEAVRVEMYFDRKRDRLVCKAHAVFELGADDGKG